MSQIQKNTVDTFAKGLYNEASRYGFQRADFVRFVNMVLELSMGPETPRVAPLEAKPASNHKTLPICTETLCLRPMVGLADKLLLENWLRDTDGQHFLRSRLTADLLSTDDLINDPNHLACVITLLDQTPIGCIAFLDIDQIQSKAELRKLIGRPEMRGKGYAKAATKHWIDFGLNGLGLKKIYLNTLSNNIHNIRLNEELGFSVEGILRNEIFLDGKHHDVVRMGLYK